MDTLQVANRVIGIMYDTGRTDIETCEKQFSRVRDAVKRAELDICDLKPLAEPLAELLGCEPEMGAMKEATHSLLGSRVSDNRRLYTAIAQALNWERTEFDTLDELLEELRASEAAHRSDDALMGEALEVLKKVETLLDAIPTRLQNSEDETLATIGHIVNGNERLYHVVRDFATKLAMRNAAPRASTTHTLLHAGELHREVTILLRTEQLVAWRTADGQEYSAPAHQVALDPDEDGLAAALLTRIAGVEIAPKHMAELRAQMAGGVK